MQTHLPKTIAPRTFAVTGRHLEGELPLALLPRLHAAVHKADGSLWLSVSGHRDEQGLAVLTGRYRTRVALLCQRCLSPVAWPLEGDFRLAVIQAEAQVNTLPGDYDPLLVDDAEVALAELVEDELLLALPLTALHDDIAVCRANGYTPVDMPAPESDGTRPFAGLDSLLRDADKSES